MNELDSLRQEAETLKNTIRVSIFLFSEFSILYVSYFMYGILILKVIHYVKFITNKNFHSFSLFLNIVYL